MRKFKNIILIALMLCSVFGVIGFAPVVAESTNLVSNSDFSSNTTGWSLGSYWLRDAGNQRIYRNSTNPTYVDFAYVPTSGSYMTIDKTKVQTLYFDYNIPAGTDSELLLDFGTEVIWFANYARGRGWSGDVDSVDISTLDGKTLQEIYETYNWRHYAWSSCPNKVNISFCTKYSGSSPTVDNVYLWQSDVKVQVDGTPVPTCGDGTCNGIETCATCAADCGSCFTGTVSHSILPASGDPNEVFIGTVSLNSGTVLIDDSNVTITRNGSAVTTLTKTQEGNSVRYSFTPVENAISFNDVPTLTANVIYNGTTYTGTASFTCGAPDTDPSEAQQGDSLTVDGLKFTFNFTKDNYELNEIGTFVNAGFVKVDTWLSPQVTYYLTVTTPDGQAGGGFTNYKVNPSNAVIKVGANSGTMNGSLKILYKTVYGVGDWKEITLHDSATIGTVSNAPGAILDSQKSLLTKIAEAPGKAVTAAAKVLGGAASVVKQALGTTYETAKDVASDVYDGGKTVVSDVADALKNPVSTAVKTLSNIGKAVGSAVSGLTGGSSSSSGILGILKGTLFGIPIWVLAIGGIFAFVLLINKN